jgi:hypothetical protein
VSVTAAAPVLVVDPLYLEAQEELVAVVEVELEVFFKRVPVVPVVPVS